MPERVLIIGHYAGHGAIRDDQLYFEADSSGSSLRQKFKLS